MTIKANGQITITDVSDAYSVNLTLDSHTFQGDVDKVVKEQSVTTTAIVMIGGSIIPSKIDFIPSPPGLFVVVDNNGISPKVTFTATNNLLSGGTVTIPIILTDLNIVINKVFSYSIAFKGSDGVNTSDGKMIFTNPLFHLDGNQTNNLSVEVTGFNPPGGITINNVPATSNNPTGSDRELLVNMAIESTPNDDYQYSIYFDTNPGEDYKTLIFSFIATIPTGLSLVNRSSHDLVTWITNNFGTDTPQEYSCKVYCDKNFIWDNCNYFDIVGRNITYTTNINIYSATCYDISTTGYNEYRTLDIEQKITPDAIISTINTEISADNSIKNTVFTMNKDGLDIKNGGLTITNSDGTIVLSGDTDGNLILNDIKANSGTIAGITINENDLESIVTSSDGIESGFKIDSDGVITTYEKNAGFDTYTNLSHGIMVLTSLGTSSGTDERTLSLNPTGLFLSYLTQSVGGLYMDPSYGMVVGSGGTPWFVFDPVVGATINGNRVLTSAPNGQNIKTICGTRVVTLTGFDTFLWNINDIRNMFNNQTISPYNVSIYCMNGDLNSNGATFGGSGVRGNDFYAKTVSSGSGGCRINYMITVAI